MSFVKSKIKRFNEVASCAPPPGTYDPKSPGPKLLKGVKFNKAERFKKPSAPQTEIKKENAVKVHSTFKIPSNFSSQSSVYSECSKKSTKSNSTNNSSKIRTKRLSKLMKLDSELTKAVANIEKLNNDTKNTSDSCKDYINTCRSACSEALENRVCRMVIENSHAALYAVCQRLRETCEQNEALQKKTTLLQEEIGEKKSFEQLAAEQIAIVEQNLTEKVNNYMKISETVKNNWLSKMSLIMVTLNELESMVVGEAKEIIQKLKLDIELTDPEVQSYKQIVEKYEMSIEKISQLEKINKNQEDLERKIIDLTNEKNALAAKLQNNKPKSGLSKNRLDVLATPRKRVDIENIAPINKTYVLKNNSLNITVKPPVAQSSPLREMNW